jgi:hypothetical protein
MDRKKIALTGIINNKKVNNYKNHVGINDCRKGMLKKSFMSRKG